MRALTMCLHPWQAGGSGESNEHWGIASRVAKSGRKAIEGLRLPDSHWLQVDAETPKRCEATFVLRFLAVRQ
jgi:hypothetical protein